MKRESLPNISEWNFYNLATNIDGKEKERVCRGIKDELKVSMIKKSGKQE